ncbi:hypothetical protein ACEQ8H_001364 [Pleosporales sp. CAS-2024a]
MAASTTVSKTIYIGAFVHCKSLAELDVCEKGAIGVDEHGTIQFVERRFSNVQDVQGRHAEWAGAHIVTLKANNGFFFPGFVDTHTHAPQHPNTGLFGKTTLLDWLQKYTFPMESSFSDVARAKRIYANFVARTLAHGTTTCAYYATIHVAATNVLADTCLRRGQRALVGRVCMDSELSPADYRDGSVERSVADSAACIAHMRRIDPDGTLVRPVVTPRFAPACTPACLSAMGQLARDHDTFIQTHISENKDEIALVARLFPHSDSYAHVYDAHALLTPKTILAHAIHLSPAERALLLARGAKIAHCPASNTALTSGCCPVRDLLDQGHTVGLGTDVSGGFSPSILENVRHAIWVSRHLAYQTANDRNKLATEEALWLATRGGAHVLGLQQKVGAFEVGMDWDAQMICLPGVSAGEQGEDDLVDGQVDVFGWENWHELVEKWVYSGDDRNTVAVWVKGRLVHWTSGYGGVDA